MMCLGDLIRREERVHHSPKGLVGVVILAAYIPPYSSAVRTFRVSGEMRLRAIMYLRTWWM